MKFASVKQIIVLTVITCVGLFGLDYYKNPQLWHSRQSVSMARPGIRLTIWMNHSCCLGCLAEVRQALTGIPGIDVANATDPKQLLTKAEADRQGASLPEYGNSVELPISDLQKLDLIAIDRALRDKGLVAGRMELSGVEHFRLEALLERICDQSIQERVAFLKAKGSAGQLKWLDSVTVDQEKKTVAAHARFLEPGKTVDVVEFLSGLNYLGYEPSSLRVIAEEKMQHTYHEGE